MLNLGVPFLDTLLYRGEGGNETCHGCTHERTSDNLNLLYTELSAGDITRDLCRAEDLIGILSVRRKNSRRRRCRHALVSRAYDEVNAELLAVDGHCSDGISAV